MTTKHYKNINSNENELINAIFLPFETNGALTIELAQRKHFNTGTQSVIGSENDDDQLSFYGEVQ